MHEFFTSIFHVEDFATPVHEKPIHYYRLDGIMIIVISCRNVKSNFFQIVQVTTVVFDKFEKSLAMIEKNNFIEKFYFVMRKSTTRF